MLKRTALRPLLAATLQMAVASPALARPGLDARMQEDGVTVLEDEKPVLFYRTKPADPQGQPGRANYIHPLYAPDGATALTEDSAHDFPEQRGLFWAWRKVMLDGQVVADGWGMSGLVYVVKETRFAGEADGSADLTLTVDWIVSSRPEVVYVAVETTVVHVTPMKDGVRRISIDTTITPKVDGLALGGSDDGRDYGGFSMRLVQGDQLAFASGGKTLTPATGAVPTAGAVGMAWTKGAGPDWTLAVSCQANGAAVTRWVLRKMNSMQNCAFPGARPVALPQGKALKLHETLVIKPRPR